MLEKHIIADDVALASVTREIGQLGLEGPGAREAARRVGRSRTRRRADSRPRASAGEPVVWIAGGSLGDEGLRVLSPRALLPALRAELALPELSPEQIEALRIEAAIPKLGSDLSPRNFPQEARLERAFSLIEGLLRRAGDRRANRLARRGEPAAREASHPRARRARQRDPPGRHRRGSGHVERGLDGQRSDRARLRARRRGARRRGARDRRRPAARSSRTTRAGSGRGPPASACRAARRRDRASRSSRSAGSAAPSASRWPSAKLTRAATACAPSASGWIETLSSRAPTSSSRNA